MFARAAARAARRGWSAVSVPGAPSRVEAASASDSTFSGVRAARRTFAATMATVPLAVEAGSHAASYGSAILSPNDLRRIVDEFSKFARMPEPDRAPEDVVDLLRGALLLQESGQPDVRFDVALPEGPMMADLDATMISQALTNLIKNAGEAIETLQERGAPEGHRPMIRVTCEDEGRQALIHIMDNGIGLPEDRARLFEPYVTTRDKGTGLGLASVDGFVRQSGGVIMVQSALGEGTTFEIYLPSLEPSKVPPSRSIRSPMTSSYELRRESPANILIVEDMELVRDLIVEVLEGSGHHVVAAASGEEALVLTQDSSRPLDLILTDLQLPGINGCDLAKRVRRTHPDAKIVFMSGYAPDDIHELDPHEIGDAFLTKPIRPRRLLATLHGLIDAG